MMIEFNNLLDLEIKFVFIKKLHFKILLFVDD